MICMCSSTNKRSNCLKRSTGVAVFRKLLRRCRPRHSWRASFLRSSGGTTRSCLMRRKRFSHGFQGDSLMRHVLLLLFIVALAIPARAQTPARTIAVTIDDLPYVRMSDAPYLPSARTATAKILGTLKKHKVPAIGFVNEAQLDYGNDREARIGLLRDWVNSGMMLGNHTYSHPDFNQLTVAQFEEQIVKGEVVTRQLMQSRRPYQLYFRHPMTHTGDTLEKKEAIDKFLADRGYKVTPHTIENSDFIFNVPYAQAVQKGDAALAKRLRDAYLDLTIAATE